MTLKTLLFLIFVFLFLFGLHFAFFRSIIALFNISRPIYRFILYTLMVLLTFSFVTAFWLLQWNEMPLTIGFYQFAGTWMGYLFHFLAALAVVWVIIGIAFIFRMPMNRSFLAAVLLIAAAGYASFGIWNAFHPRVRQVSIPVSHVPDSWKNSVIIHLSDIHLGHNHGVEFANRLVEQVNALHPDAIFITGDLFDGMGGPFESFIPVLNRLEARKGIYFVTGNHEHYIGIEQAGRLLQKLKFRVLDNEWVENEGLEIVGVSYPGIESLNRIRNLPEKQKPGNTRILLFHTPTSLDTKKRDNNMDRHFATYWQPDTTFHLNRESQADLQLSGHTHHGQIFPFNFLTSWLYRGYDYGLSKTGNLSIYTTCGTGSWGTPMRTATASEIVSIHLQPERQ